ncbi:ABC transporter ATP-binding protein [soil metagenome]
MTARPDPGGLAVDVAVRRGLLELRAAFEVAAGEVVAIVGPNGAGKSTLLQLVAGLLHPHSGTIRLAGAVLEDTASGHSAAVADRRVGMLFQDYLLFEHLRVRDNVAFGPRSRGASRDEARSIADRWLARVGLAEHADRRPATLSGGQQQRVALARALACDPACLLLDEPLSALDAETRTDIRRELRRHLADFPGPVLLVTHEPLEALALADRLVVLEAGSITQVGAPTEVARHPRSEWVARLVGVNLLSGTSSAGRVALDRGGSVVVPATTPTGAVMLTIHPQAIAVHLHQPSGSPRNVWRSRVEEVELVGDRVRVQLPGPPSLVAELTAAALAELDLQPGREVWVAFKASEVVVYPS